MEEAYNAIVGYVDRLDEAEKALREREVRASVQNQKQLASQEILHRLQATRTEVNRSLDDILTSMPPALRPNPKS